MALLLAGYVGGIRRFELAAFDLRNVSFIAEGLVLFVGRSKSGQERHGAEIGIEAVPGSALCAVAALSRWLEARGDTPGALFCRLDRGGNLVAGADGRPAADRAGHDCLTGHARDRPQRRRPGGILGAQPARRDDDRGGRCASRGIGTFNG